MEGEIEIGVTGIFLYMERRGVGLLFEIVSGANERSGLE